MSANVLLVVLDTVRAKNTSLHGHANRTTPFLDEFARERATWFTQARAPAARSLDSHVSLLTGYPVAEHGVTGATDRLEPGHTVFETLSERGYRTGVFSENNWLTDVDAGIKDAFDHVDGPRNVPFPEALDPTSFVVEHGQGAYTEFLREALRSDSPMKAVANGATLKLGGEYANRLPRSLRPPTTTPGGEYLDLLLEWIDSGTGQWAACLNLMDAHHPYEPGTEYDEWGGNRCRELQDEFDDVKWEFNGGQRPWWQRRALEGLYDGTIRQLDAVVERLVEELRARGEFEETLLVITSDHGEGFGEPSRVRPDTRVASHSDGLHEVLLHVPLVVKFPGQSDGRRITDAATVTGFSESVRRTLDGGDPAEAYTPERVLATVPGLDDRVRERAEAYCDDLTPFTGHGRIVYETVDGGVRKSVVWTSGDRRVEREIHVRDAQTAYVTGTDIGSRVEAAFADTVDRGVKTTAAPDEEMAEATRQQLEDLGYV
mgnify:CR=1 FL=1